MFTHIHHDYPKLERTTNNNGDRIYKTPTGRAYPSVTSVTGLHTKKSIMEWRERVGSETANKISSTAARRGTRIHTLCERYLQNEPTGDMSSLDSVTWYDIKPELELINNIHALETPLYSDHLEVAGTVDCIAEYKGKLSVVDFKTSSKIKQKEHIQHYFMQCSAYAVAFEERTKIPVSNLVIIMAVDDEGVHVFKEKRDNWIDKFIFLRDEYREWKKH